MERHVDCQDGQSEDVTTAALCVEAAMYKPGKGPKQRSLEDGIMVWEAP